MNVACYGSNIGENKLINNVRDLYDNDSGYHNRIYQVIEQRLKDSGICALTKNELILI